VVLLPRNSIRVEKREPARFYHLDTDSRQGKVAIAAREFSMDKPERQTDGNEE